MPTSCGRRPIRIASRALAFPALALDRRPRRRDDGKKTNFCPLPRDRAVEVGRQIAV